MNRKSYETVRDLMAWAKEMSHRMDDSGRELARLRVVMSDGLNDKLDSAVDVALQAVEDARQAAEELFRASRPIRELSFASETKAGGPGMNRIEKIASKVAVSVQGLSEADKVMAGLEILRQRFAPTSNDALFLGIVRDMVSNIQRGNLSAINRLADEIKDVAMGE